MKHPHRQAAPDAEAQRSRSSATHHPSGWRHWLVLMLALLPLLAGTHPALASDALARKNGCLGCHAKAAPMVGPSYADVAAKYRGQADAAQQLAARIRSGGAGRWGDVPMPPQAQLKDAEALRLAQWILTGPK